MTRFIANASMFKLVDYIEEACSALGCSTQFLGPQQILVSTIRKKQLSSRNLNAGIKFAVVTFAVLFEFMSSPRMDRSGS